MGWIPPAKPLGISNSKNCTWINSWTHRLGHTWPHHFTAKPPYQIYPIFQGRHILHSGWYSPPPPPPPPPHPKLYHLTTSPLVGMSGQKCQKQYDLFMIINLWTVKFTYPEAYKQNLTLVGNCTGSHLATLLPVGMSLYPIYAW